MNIELYNEKDLITMKLLYYFITIKNYNPIIVQGVKNEIWLENLQEDIKIIRIVNNYIHNNEQMEFDIFKTKRLVSKIRIKTFSLTMKVLNIFTDLGDNVDFKKINQDSKNYKFINANNESDIVENKVITKNFTDLKNNFEFNEKGFHLFLKITNDINAKNKEEALRNEEVFKPKKVFVTYILIGILVLIYLLGFIFGQANIIELFALYGPYIRKYNEYYRIVTAGFLHGNLFHLLCNCYALFIIGKQVESFYGKRKFLIIYFLSLIMGSLFSIALSENASVGASGAIFGLMGSLLYFGYYYRVYIGSTWKNNILPVILINLALGFIIPGIDYLGHIGGLIGGILASMAVGLKYKEPTRDKINGTIIYLILFVFLIYLGIFMK
ncbi:MAG: rhomboid family intramembrane serine protease [Bacilli bacterium]|nr:rhomboid family intramembrane serine protease [Bacilli bacterium]